MKTCGQFTGKHHQLRAGSAWFLLRISRFQVLFFFFYDKKEQNNHLGISHQQVEAHNSLIHHATC
jgi:hypothetical protein